MTGNHPRLYILQILFLFPQNTFTAHPPPLSTSFIESTLLFQLQFRKTLRWQSSYVELIHNKTTWDSLSLTYKLPCPCPMDTSYEHTNHQYLSLYLLPSWAFLALTLHMAFLAFKSFTWFCSLNHSPGWDAELKVECPFLAERT